MFRKPVTTDPDEARITAGTSYQRRMPGGEPETACVIAVAPDGAGIPHVRFDLRWPHADRAPERRTLALASFARQFPERVGA